MKVFFYPIHWLFLSLMYEKKRLFFRRSHTRFENPTVFDSLGWRLSSLVSKKKWSKRNPLAGKHKQQQKKKPKKVFIYIMICIGLTGCFNDGPINEKIHYGIVMITAAQNFARLSVCTKRKSTTTHTHTQ